MHLFSENLAVEVSNYYRNIVLGHGATPKVFTMVNSDGDQYLFFIDDLQMERAEEDQFLAYIVKEHDAVTYARGTLVIVEKNQQFIEYGQLKGILHNHTTYSDGLNSLKEIQFCFDSSFNTGISSALLSISIL